MSEESLIAFNGDPHYTEHVAQAFLNSLGWSRKRRKKWLRRHGFKLTANLKWDDDPEDVCWCGVKNPYYAEIHDTCGGMGILNCLCGGDQCVCHNHGEIECMGCEDCEDNEIDDDHDGYTLDELDDPNSLMNQAFP